MQPLWAYTMEKKNYYIITCCFSFRKHTSWGTKMSLYSTDDCCGLDHPIYSRNWSKSGWSKDGGGWGERRKEQFNYFSQSHLEEQSNPLLTFYRWPQAMCLPVSHCLTWDQSALHKYFQTHPVAAEGNSGRYLNIAGAVQWQFF